MYPLTTFAFISFTLVSPPEPPLETTNPFSVHVPFETLIQDNVFSSHVLCSFVESNVLSPVNYLCPLLKISCYIYIYIYIYICICIHMYIWFYFSTLLHSNDFFVIFTAMPHYIDYSSVYKCWSQVVSALQICSAFLFYSSFSF